MNKEGKANIKFIGSVLLFLLVMVFLVYAVHDIEISTPGNFTFNDTSDRNINFTFNVTWSAANENMSNCTLWINSTTNQIIWDGGTGRNISIQGNGTEEDYQIYNNTDASSPKSYMNYTFTSDGNYTWSIGCFSHNQSGGTLTFATENFTFVLDTTAPVVNTTFNISTMSVRRNDIINITANITDTFGLSFCQIIINQSGPSALEYINISLSGTTGQCSNSSKVTLTYGGVINYTIRVNDSLGNWRTNDTIITVVDNSAPTITINGTIAVNGTNISSTTILASWAITEDVYKDATLSEINISIDGTVNTEDGCIKFFRRVGAAGTPFDPNKFRNFSFTTSPDCALANGTHFIKVSVRDAAGQVEVVFHNFTVETGEGMSLVLGLIDSAVSTVNQSNITPYTKLYFNFTNGAVQKLANITWMSSCYNGDNVFANNIYNNGTGTYPFNYSGCKGGNVEANWTINLTATNTGGTSISAVYQFAVDDKAPSLVVHSPTAGVRASGLIELNVSAFDQMNRVDVVGFYLDGSNSLTNTSLNGTATDVLLAAYQGENVTFIGTSANFTAGTHTIKFSVNDSRGNVRNSSEITFTVLGPINFAVLNLNTTLREYNFNMTLVNLTNASGAPIYDVTRTVTDQTLNLFMALNATAKGVNITITFNASAANWDRYNFTILQNHSTSMGHLENNWTVVIFDYIYINTSLSNFISDDNYYGKVKIPMNASANGLGGSFELWHFADETDLTTRTNIRECSATFNPTFTLTACWNNTDNRSVDVFVPHFDIVALVNDSKPPTMTINKPITIQTESSFRPNITVSADATGCNYTINTTGPRIAMTKLGTSCWAPSTVTNLTNGTTVNNITFYVWDVDNNLNTTWRLFAINDTTFHNMTGITISSPTSSAATVTVTANESVNLTIYNSTSPGATTVIAASKYSNVSTFAKSQSITFSSLTASTYYNFTVRTCDKAGNCLVNLTLGFKTSAVATTTTTPAAAAAGGGGGAVAVSKVADSKSQMWSAIPAGSSFSLNVDKATIAITSVAVSDVKSELRNVDLEVQALKENPVSTDAAAKVYQYLRINKKNIADTDAESLKIRFRVTKAWLTENSLASGDISLYRYKDDKWNELATSVTGTDSLYVNYEADTPGFSSFAVGVKSGVVVEEEVPEEVPAEEVPEEVAPPEEVEAPTPVVAPGRAPIAWIIAAVVIILGIVLIVAYQKKKQQI